nr:MAG TPA: hypothetical protein [Caudoviricetes sp.]
MHKNTTYPANIYYKSTTYTSITILTHKKTTILSPYKYLLKHHKNTTSKETSYLKHSFF